MSPDIPVDMPVASSVVPDVSNPESTAGQANSEGCLLQRHLAGDRAAFPALVQSYRAAVYSYLCRSGVKAAERDDLFQEVFLKIHRSIARFEPGRPAHPWIFTIVANTVRNHLRRQRVRQLAFQQSEEAGVPEPVDPAPDGERRVAARQAAHVVDSEMHRLSPIQRQVLLLAGVEKLSMKETAEALGLPVGTVKTHLRRARLILAKALMRHGMGGAQ